MSSRQDIGHRPPRLATGKASVKAQQELVTRLSQPCRRPSHPAAAPPRCQPMKACDTKELPPFRPGGVHKVASTRQDVGRRRPRPKATLRAQQELVTRLSQPRRRPFQEKDKGANEKVLPPFRPGGVHKVASTRQDVGRRRPRPKTTLRAQQELVTRLSQPRRRPSHSAAAAAPRRCQPMKAKELPPGGVAPVSSDSAGKGKRKQTETSSCSDILNSSPTPTSSSAESSTTSSSSHTSLEHCPWPRTSTQGNRDELTPDGCCSPEESASDRADKGSLLQKLMCPSASDTVSCPL